MVQATLIKVLNELYEVNKVLRQLERWYGTSSQSAHYMYKHNLPETKQWSEGFAIWTSLYETKLDKEAALLGLSKERLDQLRVKAKNKQPVDFDIQELFPVCIAFLIYWGNRLTWFEEIGPFVVEGPWLAEDEPWLEKGQWPEAKGQWYLFIGDQLEFVGDTREEFEAFVYGMAFSILALPDEIFAQIKPFDNLF